MGQRQLNRLSARTVATKRAPGFYGDGGGLYLQLAAGGNKAWIFRYRSPLTKKPRYMGSRIEGRRKGRDGSSTEATDI